MIRISCGKCDKCLERLPELCEVTEKPKEASLRPIGQRLAPAAGGSKTRQDWMMKVRKKVWDSGLAWWDVRDKFGQARLRQLCLDGVAPDVAAQMAIAETKGKA